MKFVKCIKFDLEIVCENDLDSSEAKKWIEQAMDVYCDFEGCRVDIVEEHEVATMDEGVASA